MLTEEGARGMIEPRHEAKDNRKVAEQSNVPSDGIAVVKENPRTRKNEGKIRVRVRRLANPGAELGFAPAQS